jgi:hypothetical protein
MYSTELAYKVCVYSGRKRKVYRCLSGRRDGKVRRAQEHLAVCFVYTYTYIDTYINPMGFNTPLSDPNQL